MMNSVSFEQFSAWLESLGDARNAHLVLDYWRTDDFRRKAMSNNKTPLVSYSAYVQMRSRPEDTYNPDIHTKFNFETKEKWDAFWKDNPPRVGFSHAGEPTIHIEARLHPTPQSALDEVYIRLTEYLGIKDETE